MKKLLIARAVVVCCALTGLDDSETVEKKSAYSAKEIELRVKEAEAVIVSYQQKVDSAKIDLKKCQIRAKYAELRLNDLKDLVKGQAISKVAFQKAEQRHEEALVDCEAAQNDIEEAEADLELVKIRKLLAAEGHWSFSMNPIMSHRK